MKNDVIKLLEQLETFIKNADSRCCYLQKYSNKSVLAVPIPWGKNEINEFIDMICLCLYQQYDDKDAQILNTQPVIFRMMLNLFLRTTKQLKR